MDVLWDRLTEWDWRRLSKGAPMQQDWAYGAACAALGSRVLRAEIRTGNQTIGLAQLVHRRLLGCLHAVVCTRGPIWLNEDPSERANALLTLHKALPFPRLRGLFTTPDTADPSVVRRAGLTRVMTPYATAVIDLTAQPDSLRAGMHQKWRNRLVVAESAGLTVRRADKRPDRYRWLLDLETRQQRANRYTALPPMLVPAWQKSGGGLRVYAAEQNGTPIAAMLFLLHGGRATYHVGWADAAGRKASAHNLLLWTAMRKLPRAGITELDLGGLNTEDAAGIARFKLGSGARLKTLCGTWFAGPSIWR